MATAIKGRNGEILRSAICDEYGRLNVVTNDSKDDITYVNGKQQGTVFGADMVISQEKPEVSGKFNVGLNVSNVYSVFVGSGKAEIVADESILYVSTGTDNNGVAVIATKQRVRYEPGTPIYAKFTAAFPAEDESNGDYLTAIGFSENLPANQVRLGIYQRRVSGVITYGFFVNRGDGEATVYYEANGELPINPENLNIFRVEWGYLGVAPFNVYWRDTETQLWKLFHRQVFESDVTSVLRPDLSVGVFAENQGNTTDVGIKVGSFQAGTINGGKGIDPSARTSTYLRNFTGTAGTDQLIFAFRNPVNVTMYDKADITGIPTTRSFVNPIASQLLEVGLNVLDNNKLVNIELVIVPSEDLTDGTFTPVDLGYSVIEVSEDVTPVLTNEKRLEIFTRGKDDAQKEIIETLDLLLPGQTALFIYTTTSVAFDFTAFIKYQDLF